MKFDYDLTQLSDDEFNFLLRAHEEQDLFGFNPLISPLRNEQRRRNGELLSSDGSIIHGANAGELDIIDDILRQFNG